MRYHVMLFALCALIAGWPARAQETKSDPHPYGSGAGVEILLTNSGFGLGGYDKRAVSPSLSVIGEMNLSAGKDESEGAFFNRFGQRFIRGKANYLLMVPARIGLQKRLFRRRIEPNFRPFVQVSAGPTGGYVYPYFEDENGNGRYDGNSVDTRHDVFSGLLKGHVRMGAGVLVAVGAHFGWSQKNTRGVRIGYRFDYFPEGVQLLEPAANDAQRFLGSPTIAVRFGRVF